MFGPLLFEETKSLEDSESQTKCILCEDSFNLDLSLPMFAAHLFSVHDVIIEDIQNITNLKEYILYWRNRFKTVPIDQIIPSINMTEVNKMYFLISTIIKEDKELRHKLKLENALQVQETERSDGSFKRPCLFCKLQFEGTRQGFLEHLSQQHNLQLGNPQNLVFIEKLINKIEEKLNDLQCIYCEKTFPNRNILKEHMRKKLHKRINAENKIYDEYYIVNYLEQDKDWHAIEKEEDHYAITTGANSDEEYEDWCETESKIACLFCSHKETNINFLCLHMDSEHDFDFALLTNTMDFYQKVKLVNYIRKQIHNNKCIFCDQAFESPNSLSNHLNQEEHYKLPEMDVFDQPEYYFPTYENDSFLYLIDDVED